MSIPESFTIYHGENLFSNGPDGVFKNMSTTNGVMHKQLLGPQYLSFQQVRLWIFDMFKVDEATHELVLRQIVVLKPKHKARPYSIVVDIIGLDSWRTFLDLKCHQSEPKALYMQWHAKAAPGPVGVEGAVGEKDGTTPAPAPVPTPVTAAEDPAVAAQHGGSWPSCKKHGKSRAPLTPPGTGRTHADGSTPALCSRILEWTVDSRGGWTRSFLRTRPSISTAS